MLCFSDLARPTQKLSVFLPPLTSDFIGLTPSLRARAHFGWIPIYSKRKGVSECFAFLHLRSAFFKVYFSRDMRSAKLGDTWRFEKGIRCPSRRLSISGGRTIPGNYVYGWRRCQEELATTTTSDGWKPKDCQEQTRCSAADFSSYAATTSAKCETCG